MTLPTSDAQSSRSLPRRPNIIPVSHSMPASSPVAPIIPNASSSSATHLPVTPAPIASQVEGFSVEGQHDNAVNFASHSWDLATGGLKTMTAKREMPSWHERRPNVQTSESAYIPRNYVFLLVILVCLLLMLVSGGVILFVMLQP
ncbi:MAG: hypothetical protein ACYDER_10470 [Ktedonobacteraceae bacterium]